MFYILLVAGLAALSVVCYSYKHYKLAIFFAVLFGWYIAGLYYILKLAARTIY